MTLLWPDLEPEAPPMKSADVIGAIAKRHPMDGYGGEPGLRGELRPRVVHPAPVRQTPNPGPAFWAAVIRRAAGLAAAS